jgi:phosphotriesterase-related protein
MSDKVRTVCGDVKPSEIAGALCHEHTLLYHRSKMPRKRYIAEAMSALRRRLAAEFRRLIARGCNTFVDCNTREGIRIPAPLREIAAATGMHLVTCTGFYTEASLSQRIRGASVDEIASMMMKDVTVGMDRTDVRCGVVKVASNTWTPGPGEMKVFRAAAKVHRKTGVPITTHTTKGCQPQIDWFIARGVDPSKVAFGHIEVDPWESILYAARKGAMLLFTNFGGKQWVPEDMIIAEIADLVRRGFVKQIMISVDMFLYWKNGRLLQRWPGGFLQIFDRVIPRLLKAGLKSKHIDTIIRDNPRKHLAF